MTKIQEWEKMIEYVENDSVSKIEILKFLKANKPKPRESKKELPCTCGSKDIHTWLRSSPVMREIFCKCCKCDKEGPGDIREIGAIRKWNEMIKKEIENGTAD